MPELLVLMMSYFLNRQSGYEWSPTRSLYRQSGKEYLSLYSTELSVGFQ